MMKNKVVVLSCVLALVFCLGALSLAGAAEKEPVVGQSVGAAKFKAPVTEDMAKYLGLASAAPFSLADVKAPYVLVEQFSSTCPHCIAQAPVMNSLFNLVENDAQMKGKLKFIGTGQGDDEAKMKMWKAFHKVPFALVPDTDNSFGKAMNFTPYPVTVVLDKTGKILFVHIGAFDSADEVFKKLKAIVK
jgi:peroxiredoxin